MEFFICSCDLTVRLRAVNALCKLSYPEIAHSGTDALRRPVHDGSTAVDIAKIAIGDSPAQIFLKDDIVENSPEASIVPSPRRRGEPDVEARPQVVENFTIRRCQGMVRLIGDNHIEFARLKVSLESICERLDRSRDDLLAMRVPFGLFDAYRAAVVLNRLGNQFLTV